MALDPITAGLSALNTIGGLIDKVIPDTNARASAKEELVKLAQSGDLQITLAQLGVNNQEAQSDNVFIAGWRPFIGWVCGSAFAFQYVFAPMFSWFSDTPLPVIDLGSMMPVLLGMLGLGAYRTYEKVNKADTRS